MTDRQRRVAVVTGGATGIGLSTVHLLVERGVDVVFGGRDRSRGEAAAGAIGSGPGKAVFIPCDVRREQDLAGLVDAARSRFGGVDWMFNNAGVEGALALLGDAEEAVVNQVLDTNLRGVIWGTKHAVRAMQAQGRGGAIVSTASFVGSIVPLPVGAVYGATKAAVISLMRSTAASFGAQNIRAYAVCPWMTETPMLDRLTGGQAAARAQFESINPSKKFASSSDIARVVLDLFEGKGAYGSGDAVLVDHGGQASLISTPEVRPVASA